MVGSFQLTTSSDVPSGTKKKKQINRKKKKLVDLIINGKCLSSFFQENECISLD